MHGHIRCTPISVANIQEKWVLCIKACNVLKQASGKLQHSNCSKRHYKSILGIAKNINTYKKQARLHLHAVIHSVRAKKILYCFYFLL